MTNSSEPAEFVRYNRMIYVVNWSFWLKYLFIITEFHFLNLVFTLQMAWTIRLLKTLPYLLAKPEEPDVVGATRQTTGSVKAARFDGLPPDFGHDVALAAQILVTQRQKVVDHKSWKKIVVVVNTIC